jgi:2'-5' RNA ligase
LKYRLFAALELPARLQATLAELQTAFSEQLPPRVVRWAKPDGIHLTLKFYGDVRAERAPEFQAGLARAVQAAGAAAASVPLLLRGLGVFPSPARPQVLWVGLEGDLAPLRRLQQAVESEAEALGYPPEARPFAPHLTLGRVRARLSPSEAEALLGFLRRTQVEPLGDFLPASLHLMSSDRRPMGASYTTLYAAPLDHKELTSGTP